MVLMGKHPLVGDESRPSRTNTPRKPDISTYVRLCCSYKLCPRCTISVLAYRGCGIGPTSFQENPVALSHGGDYRVREGNMADVVEPAQRGTLPRWVLDLRPETRFAGVHGDHQGVLVPVFDRTRTRGVLLSRRALLRGLCQPPEQG